MKWTWSSPTLQPFGLVWRRNLPSRDYYCTQLWYSKLQPTRPTCSSFGLWYSAGMIPRSRLCRFVSIFASHANVFSRKLILLLLLIGCLHPNPRPPRRPPPPSKRLTSWKCNGIHNLAAELNNFLSSQNVIVACIQESKLSSNTRLPAMQLSGWVGEGGGLLTLVHHSVQFSEIASPINNNVSEVIIQLNFSDSVLKIANVYIPPASSCPPGFHASLSASRRRYGRYGGCEWP